MKLTSQGLGQANIQKVDLRIPVSLPSRQETLKGACLESLFNTNPAGCPAVSVIGTAIIHTPVLKSPLAGPAYLVSHGGAEFPDVEFVLQGEGITLILDGKTFIDKNGFTYSKFEAAPDAPFTSFETQLPAGPHSILTAYLPGAARYELCGTKLSIPTEITSQAGTTIKENTPVAITGCTTSKPKPTNAQLLAKALKACHTRYKHNPRKRTTCERTAKRRYPVKKPAHKNSKKTSTPR